MNLLLSNDDGIHAPGLRALARALQDAGHQVTVVAPEGNKSGVSGALTLDRPLYVTETEEGFFAVNGNPADCVHLALTALMKAPPDMVVSGINNGPNLGDDTFYSGTVAAAWEGRRLGYAALALSQTSFKPRHFASGARVAARLIARMAAAGIAGDTVLNVNIPDVPEAELKGFLATRLGHRERGPGVLPSPDPRGRAMYWIGATGPSADAGPGTDFHAVAEGYVSVTPLLIDFTRHDRLAELSPWLAGVAP